MRKLHFILCWEYQIPGRRPQVEDPRSAAAPFVPSSLRPFVQVCKAFYSFVATAGRAMLLDSSRQSFGGVGVVRVFREGAWGEGAGVPPSISWFQTQDLPRAPNFCNSSVYST